MSRMKEKEKKIMKNEIEELLRDIEVFESELNRLEKKANIYEEKMAIETFEENIKVVREELENFWTRYKDALVDYELKKIFGEVFFPRLDKITKILEGFKYFYSETPETEMIMKELSNTLNRILDEVKDFKKKY